MKTFWQLVTFICFLGLVSMLVAENYPASIWAFISMMNAFTAMVFSVSRKRSKLSIEGVRRPRTFISRA